MSPFPPPPPLGVFLFSNVRQLFVEGKVDILETTKMLVHRSCESTFSFCMLCEGFKRLKEYPICKNVKIVIL